MRRITLKREPNLKAKLEAFAHQADAVKAISHLDYAGIFHEQGLGKSKIAIDILLDWLESEAVDTVVLVVKKALVDNWMRELAMHSYITPRILNQNRMNNYHVFNSPARLILTHYEVVKSESERFALFLKTRDVGVILDESTKIKNPDSAITRALHALSPLFKKRVIMSGTPVANRPFDLWSQIYFLDQGRALGDDFDDFKQRLDLTSELAESQDQRERFENFLRSIHGRVAHFTVRQTKDSGVIELPDKIIESVMTDWEPRQLDLYEEVRTNMRAVVIRDGLPAEDHAEDLLKRLLRLVQIASNPGLVDEGYKEEPGKLPYLETLVEQLIARNEKCIVWTGFTENVDWLAVHFEKYGTCKVHGKLAIEERNKAVRRFLDDKERRVFVATPGAAKEGLTLTVANNVIFYDRSFSLDDYLQAQDRIHRISQTRVCNVYNLIMSDSIDEWVEELLRAKELAAKLAQGDISYEYYKSQMSYEFAEILKGILDIN
jgi:SNF2 family DNA or RNA helicase